MFTSYQFLQFVFLLMSICSFVKVKAQNSDIIFEDDFKRQELGADWMVNTGWSIRDGHLLDQLNNNLLLTSQSFTAQNYEIEVDGGDLLELYSRSYLFYFGSNASEGYFLRYNSIGHLVLTKEIAGQPHITLDVLEINSWEIDSYKIRHYENGLIEVFIGKSGKYADTPDLQAMDTSFPELGQLGWIIYAGENVNAEFTVDYIKVRSINPPFVESFTLVNAELDQDITTINDGEVINLGELGIAPETKLNIRANGNFTSDNSIQFDLTGPQNFTKTDNTSPYALFGNLGENDFLGEALSAGAYTIQASPYTNQNLQGDPRSKLAVSFELHYNSSPIEELILVNADTDEEIMSLEDGVTIESSDLVNTNLNFVAKLTPNSMVDSVIFKLDGAFSHEQTEKRFPYSLFGDFSETDFKGRPFCIGAFTLTVIPFTQGNAQSDTPLQVNFCVNINNPIELFFVNTDTQEDIRQVSHTEYIDFGDYNHPISIRADVMDCVQKVSFEMIEAQTRTLNTVFYKTENISPYAINGDFPRGTILPWNPSFGTYYLNVYGYTGNKTLFRSYYLEIGDFNFVTGDKNHDSPMLVYPNPIQDNQLKLHFEEITSDDYQLMLADFQGRVIYQENIKVTTDIKTIDLSDLGLRAGVYILNISNTEGTVNQIIVKE